MDGFQIHSVLCITGKDKKNDKIQFYNFGDIDPIFKVSIYLTLYKGSAVAQW